jgi:hypothetical protein
MSNPPSISLLPGVPKSFRVIVTANNVLPDGSNPGQLDTTTPLIIDPISGTGPNGAIVCIPSVDPSDNRRVVCAPGATQPGAAPAPWSFHVRANGRTVVVIASGTTAAPADVSGVSWDGITPA